MNWTPDELQAIVDEHALVLFMKGTPNDPQCGFSNRAAQAMQQFPDHASSLCSRRIGWRFRHCTRNAPRR